MAGCQSGFHDQKLQKKLVKVPVESGPNVVLCDFCLSRMIESQQQGGDLTMAILYQWAKEYNNIPQLPESLRRDCLKRSQIVQFVNQQLLRIRTANLPYSPRARAESFKKIMITSNEDPIYESGVQAAPVWELIENAAPDKKMYLDGILNVFDSPVAKYLKDRNKRIISADDIEINK
jgi:hypothetical protein